MSFSGFLDVFAFLLAFGPMVLGSILIAPIAIPVALLDGLFMWLFK